MDINKLKEKARLLLEIPSSLDLGYSKIGEDYMFWVDYKEEMLGAACLVFSNGDLNNHFFLFSYQGRSSEDGIEGDFKIEFSNESKKNKLLIVNILFEYCNTSKVQLFKMLSSEDYLVLHFIEPFGVSRELKKNGIDFNMERVIYHS